MIIFARVRQFVGISFNHPLSKYSLIHVLYYSCILHEKYFFEDWGMMNAITGFANRDIGKMLENVVYIHLKIKGFEVHVGSLNSLEIDFVAEKNGITKYFQVCYLMSSNDEMNREFGSLEAVPDHYPKFVISLDKQAPANRKGIRHLHLLDFLTKTDWE